MPQKILIPGTQICVCVVHEACGSTVGGVLLSKDLKSGKDLGVLLVLSPFQNGPCANMHSIMSYGYVAWLHTALQGILQEALISQRGQRVGHA